MTLFKIALLIDPSSERTKMTKGIILVTGYGGFLGSAVCRWLLDRGFQVRGIARHRYPAMAQLGVEGIEGDLRDIEKVREACRGVSGIIHTAALAGVWGPRELYESINVAGTERLLESARQMGVSAFVYSSSPSVTFDGSPQSGIDESVPYPQKWLCHYPRTKAIAERYLLARNEPGRMLTCSLRPHLIWGAGDPHLIPRVIDRCRRGKLKRVGSGMNRIDTVHVDAAAAAHGLALERLLQGDTEAAGKAYFITDGVPIGCWDWITQILSLEGLPAPKAAIPLKVAYAIGGLLELVYAAMRKKEEPPMTRFVALQLGVDHYFSIESAKQLLGYKPLQDRELEFAKLRQSWKRA